MCELEITSVEKPSRSSEGKQEHSCNASKTMLDYRKDVTIIQIGQSVSRFRTLLLANT